jgi:hypothetical protein
MRISKNFIYLAAIGYNPEQVICQVVVFLLFGGVKIIQRGGLQQSSQQ